jgi:hypothetical protein
MVLRNFKIVESISIQSIITSAQLTSRWKVYQNKSGTNSRKEIRIEWTHKLQFTMTIDQARLFQIFISTASE